MKVDQPTHANGPLPSIDCFWAGWGRHRFYHRLFAMTLLVAGLCFAPAHVIAGAKRQGTAPSSRRRTTRLNASRSRSRGRSKSRKAGRLRTRAQRRRHRAQLHLEPQRVTEIQHGLIQAGYLRGEPSGRWDDQTRDAMRRYQEANGFSPTGLPDAKSLMKLGLGPHPLPPDVVSSRASPGGSSQ